MTNPPKNASWHCVKCSTANPIHNKTCKKCDHEPKTGRYDVHPEGRRFNPNTPDRNYEPIS